jgi:uncharacterized protein YjbJ (UPF0337 family)
MREGYSRMGRESTKVKPEGALEKAMGHVKDAAGSPSGNKALKTAGEADQAKGPSRRVLQKPTELVARKQARTTGPGYNELYVHNKQ